MDKPVEKTDEEKTSGSLYILQKMILRQVQDIAGRQVLCWRELASDIDKAGYKLVKK